MEDTFLKGENMYEEKYFEIENEEWAIDRNYYKLRLRRLKREQEELAIEVIHYNNHRKFSLICRCVEFTLIAGGIIFACFLISMGEVMSYFCGGMFLFALVIPFSIYSIFGWKASIKEERDRKKSINRLKTLQEEIEAIEFKIIDI